MKEDDFSYCVSVRACAYVCNGAKDMTVQRPPALMLFNFGDVFTALVK